MACDYTTANFLIRFPEFQKAPESMVEAFIEEGRACLSRETWGSKHCVGVYYYAAKALASSPYARKMRLVSGDAAVAGYARQFTEIAKGVSLGCRLV